MWDDWKEIVKDRQSYEESRELAGERIREQPGIRCQCGAKCDLIAVPSPHHSRVDNQVLYYIKARCPNKRSFLDSHHGYYIKLRDNGRELFSEARLDELGITT